MKTEILNRLVQALQNFEAVALVTLTDAKVPGSARSTLGAQCLVWLDEDHANVGDLILNETTTAAVRAVIRDRRHRSVHVTTDDGQDLELFVEVHRKPPHLLIVGAGHIAVPLAAMGTLCQFTVTVLDDRPQYANAQRFPQADQVLAADLLPALRSLRNQHQLDDQTFVALVTRGHQYDVDCLAELIHDDLPYIGMIGSKRRIRAVFALLQTEKDMAKSLFTNVYAPIGLNLGAQTPAEIAVAIMAEIINLIHQGPMPSFRDEL